MAQRGVLALALALFLSSTTQSLLFKTPVVREGVHGQALVGLGGGPNNDGLFASVEIGGTLPNGLTLAALHVLLQNKGVLGPYRGADAIGGSLAELKVPLVFPEVEAKVALGLGVILDESQPLLHVLTGVGIAYGFDLHVPIFASHGPTLGITFLHVLVPQHYFTACVGAGYTFF
jgi:hypothetical protein